tara:strand:+ start:106 stop:435 length:330 start_codon:yes stop_codon:yes gene_type:complete
LKNYIEEIGRTKDRKTSSFNVAVLAEGMGNAGNGCMDLYLIDDGKQGKNLFLMSQNSFATFNFRVWRSRTVSHPEILHWEFAWKKKIEIEEHIPRTLFTLQFDHGHLPG